MFCILTDSTLLHSAANRPLDQKMCAVHGQTTMFKYGCSCCLQEETFVLQKEATKWKSVYQKQADVLMCKWYQAK